MSELRQKAFTVPRSIMHQSGKVIMGADVIVVLLTDAEAAIEAAATLNRKLCQSCGGRGSYYYGTTEYPGKGPCERCEPISKAIRALAGAPTEGEKERKAKAAARILGISEEQGRVFVDEVRSVREVEPEVRGGSAGLIAEARQQLRGTAKGPWSWSQTYQLDSYHWCLHNAQSDAEGKTIDAALILNLDSPEWFGTPFPKLPHARFIAWSRDGIERLIAALEASERERQDIRESFDHVCEQRNEWFSWAAAMLGKSDLPVHTLRPKLSGLLRQLQKERDIYRESAEMHRQANQGLNASNINLTHQIENAENCIEALETEAKTYREAFLAAMQCNPTLADVDGLSEQDRCRKAIKTGLALETGKATEAGKE